MSESCTAAAVASPRNSGHGCPPADKIVRRKFGDVAKVLWLKPDVEIAIIAGCDPRTGRRILRGEAAVPVEVALAAMAEMLKPIE